MTVERKYETIEIMEASSLRLSGTVRLSCKIVDGGGNPYVSLGPRQGNAVYASNPEGVKDAITWAEDFITLLRRL